MQIVKPWIEIKKFDGVQLMKNLELAAKQCYRTTSNITDESYKNFLRNCINRGHLSVIEHEKVSIRMCCDIGVYKDLTRHRHASFSIESTRYCVAGSTKLTFKNPHNRYTVAELYNMAQNSKNGSWKRIKIRQLDENTGKLQYSNIKNIYKTGIKKCYKIVTDLHYELVCTLDHQIYTPNGYMKLQDLKINDYIYVNGQTITQPLYQNYDWLYYQYVTLNKSYAEIADEFGYVLSTVKKWGHKFKLPYKGCGYKNSNREPWNKGFSENDDIRVKNQANALRKNRYDRWKVDSYDRAPNGQVILEATDRVYRKYRKDYCEICDKKDCKLEVHHKDSNHNNFNETNFITTCPKCHQGIENKSLDILYADKIIAIEYVGDLEVYDIEINNDNHNFVANGVIVHNCNYSKDRFGNELKFIEPMFYVSDWTNKNYEGAAMSENEQKSAIWYYCMEDIEERYLQMTSIGCTTDELRMILPHSTAAELYMTANMREWRHIFSLRAQKEAHPAVQQVMIPLLLYFKEQMPELFDVIPYNEKFDVNKYAEIKIIE